MNENDYSSLSKRIDKLEGLSDAILKLTVQIEKNVLEVKFMREEFNNLSEMLKNNIDSLTKRVNEMENKPVRKYELITNTITTGIISAIVAGIVTLLK